MIERIEVYKTKGKVFDTANKAVEYREGLVDEFFRSTPGFQDLRAKERIAFIQSVLDRRDVLIDLLSYETPTESE